MRYRRILLLALLATACVGHPADDEDDLPGPDVPVVDPSEEVFGPSLVLDFTATWCVNCPRMSSAIEEAIALRPGSIFPVAVHFGDEFSSAEGSALSTLFGVQAYPSVVVNLDKGSLSTATSKDIILSRIDAMERKAPCTLELSYADGTIHAEITAAEAGAYKAGAMLLESGLVAPQKGGSDDYVHDNILREILSADIFGEDLGALEAGASVSVDYPAGALWGGNFHAVVYVTEGGIVNSAAAVTLP